MQCLEVSAACHGIPLQDFSHDQKMCCTKPVIAHEPWRVGTIHSGVLCHGYHELRKSRSNANFGFEAPNSSVPITAYR